VLGLDHQLDPEPDCQDNLDALLARQWPNHKGRPMGISSAAFDANYLTDQVLAYAKEISGLAADRRARRASDAAPRIAKVQRERDEKKGTLRKYGGRFYNIGVSTFKMSLYRDLAKGNPTAPGFVSFPTGMEDRYFKELCSEERVAHKRFGQTIWRWEKISDRQSNEMLDCLIYATAAAIKAGVSGISEQGWNRLEAQIDTPVEHAAAAAAAPPRPAGPPEGYQPEPIAPAKPPWLAPRPPGWIKTQAQPPETDAEWVQRRLREGGWEG
jgi:phage terminase large subunit GpA-like protein